MICANYFVSDSSVNCRKRGCFSRKENASKDVSWRQLGLMLETMGVMASLTRPWLLVAPLSQCLQSSLALDFTIIDVTQQQILSALLDLLQKSVEELGEGIVPKLLYTFQIGWELVSQFSQRGP